MGRNMSSLRGILRGTLKSYSSELRYFTIARSQVNGSRKMDNFFHSAKERER
jgi:hypothetical protein